MRKKTAPPNRSRPNGDALRLPPLSVRNRTPINDTASPATFPEENLSPMVRNAMNGAKRGTVESMTDASTGLDKESPNVSHRKYPVGSSRASSTNAGMCFLLMCCSAPLR